MLIWTRATMCGGVLAGLALLAPLTLAAQVSLSSAVELALRSDPRMRVATADIDKARAVLAETHSAYIPNFGLSGGYGGSTGVPLSVPVVFGISSQSLLFNFSQRDNVRAAASGVQAAELAAQDIHDQIAEDVAVTYLNLDHAERRQAALVQEYGYAARLVEIVQARLDAGADNKIELLQARLTADQIKLQRHHSEDDVRSLSEHLARLIGTPGTALTTVPSSVPEMPALTPPATEGPDSYSVRAAFETAHSKRELAFGEARYTYRPQMSFVANYSRISTAHTSYPVYYPGFQSTTGLSDNALSVGIQVQIPLLDRAHKNRAQADLADATHAYFEAESAQRQFIEGRAKLRRAAEELGDQTQVAQDKQELAQAQVEAVLAQLTAASGVNGQPQLSPKDEQNARLQERARMVELLDAQYELLQTEVNLMRQTGQLRDWLKTIPGTATAKPAGQP